MVVRRYGLTLLLMDGASLLRLSSSTSATTTKQSCCLRVSLTFNLFTDTNSRFSFRVCWRDEVRSSRGEWGAFLQRPTGVRMALTGFCYRILHRGRGALRSFADSLMLCPMMAGMGCSWLAGIRRGSGYRSASNASSRNGSRQMRHGVMARARRGGLKPSFRNGRQKGLSHMNNFNRLLNGILDASCRRCS